MNNISLNGYATRISPVRPKTILEKIIKFTRSTNSADRLLISFGLRDGSKYSGLLVNGSEEEDSVQIENSELGVMFLSMSEISWVATRELPRELLLEICEGKVSSLEFVEEITVIQTKKRVKQVASSIGEKLGKTIELTIDQSLNIDSIDGRKKIVAFLDVLHQVFDVWCNGKFMTDELGSLIDAIVLTESVNKYSNKTMSLGVSDERMLMDVNHVKSVLEDIL